jgi:hypothetical protein
MPIEYAVQMPVAHTDGQRHLMMVSAKQHVAEILDALFDGRIFVP